GPLLAAGLDSRNCGPPTRESPSPARIIASIGSLDSPSSAEVSMPTPPRLSATALASALTKLPGFSTSSAVDLDPVRIALARAIASGQDADQLARDLSTPPGWQSVDFCKPPILPKPAAPSPQQTAPAATKPLLVAPKAATSAPPEWIAKIVPIATAKNISSRVVVLDREPTALGGLERPSWARALSPAATYGPITVSNALFQVSTSKWIQIFHSIETVEFVRGSTVLCTLPISTFVSGPATHAAISSGSAWLAAQLFAAAAPADGFAGIAIQSGEVACDQPLTFGGTMVSVPATANLSLSLVPAASGAGPAGFPARVTAPTKIAVHFPATGSPSIAFDHCSATLYSEHVTCAAAHLPAAYNAALALLYVPGQSTTADFKPQPVAGKLLELGGTAPIESAGWALSVSESTPSALGAASGAGYFGIVFGTGISCLWTGITRSESAALGGVIAQNDELILSVISGSAPGVLVEQKFQLWDDQDTSNQRRCQLVAGRWAGQPLTYALTAHAEVVEYGAVLDALVDHRRPHPGHFSGRHRGSDQTRREPSPHGVFGNAGSGNQEPQRSPSGLPDGTRQRTAGCQYPARPVH